MHLMIAAWDTVVESELEWLGLAAQILESEAILTGPLLHPSGDWEPSDMVQIVPDDVALESMSEAFQALTTDYRLSLLYIARVISIEGRRGSGRRTGHHRRRGTSRGGIVTQPTALGR